MVADALSGPQDLGPIVLAADALGTFVSALDRGSIGRKPTWACNYPQKQLLEVSAQNEASRGLKGRAYPGRK